MSGMKREEARAILKERTSIELPFTPEDVRKGERRVPKISDMVVFHHPASKDPKPVILQSPAVVTKVIERGREYDISICVLSAYIGVVFREKVPQGTAAGEWDWVQ